VEYSSINLHLKFQSCTLENSLIFTEYMKIKIAAVQMEIIPWNLQANYEKIKQYFIVAENHKCNFICFPEECWVGLKYTEKRENEVADFVKDRVSKLAKHHNLHVVAGSFVEHHTHDRIAKHSHNFCYLFGPKGEVMGRYAKRHPVPSLEQEITAGHSHRVFDTEYGKIGIQICRDILYPETTKITANLGAKIIFSPAFWFKYTSAWDETASNKKYHANSELRAIKYLVPARAIENEVIVAFVNAAGEFKSPLQQFTLLGYTQIAQPFSGPIKVFKHNREKILLQTIDTSVIEQARIGWRIRGN